MNKPPQKIEVNYNILRELFDLTGLQYNVYPNDVDMQNLLQKVKGLISNSSQTNKQHFKPIKDLFSITDDNKHNILVVDDLVLVTYQLSILLSKMDYKVTLARSAPEAISIFKTTPFDYVLMDLHLPNKEDGISLLQKLSNEIRMENLKTKIIVMSSLADPESVRFCIKNGASSFVEKNEDWKKEIVECLNKI